MNYNIPIDAQLLLEYLDDQTEEAHSPGGVVYESEKIKNNILMQIDALPEGIKREVLRQVAGSLNYIVVFDELDEITKIIRRNQLNDKK